jgi:ethanolamine utilization microcompartment shell protein EutS
VRHRDLEFLCSKQGVVPVGDVGLLTADPGAEPVVAGEFAAEECGAELGFGGGDETQVIGGVAEDEAE